MQVSDKDRRALLILGAAFVLFLLFQTDLIFPAPDASASASQSIEVEENQLLLAQTQVRQEPLLSSENQAVRALEQSLEARLLKSESAALAQAEMRERVGELLQGAGISMRASRFAPVEAEGEDFAQVPLVIDFDCDIARFVNLLADVANAPELLSTREIKVSSSNQKTKSVRVELTVSGYLPISRTPGLVKKTGGRS
ncbi:MAG TPA: type II secretion system protein GspM [Bryobacterales bacterium]|nr:type II secretion system protein GspM [Bryobacterales bacterium]